jgi:hypothetical protein
MREYRDKLVYRGYECIGRGIFSYVYARPGSCQVIKVGTVDYGFRNDGYLAFLRKVDPTNPHLPKISAVRLYRDLQDPENGRTCYYVVVMERLSPFASIPYPKRRKLFQELGLKNFRCLRPGISSNGNIDCFKLRKVATILDSLYTTYKADIHTGNIMWRRRRGRRPELVIVDPISVLG